MAAVLSQRRKRKSLTSGSADTVVRKATELDLDPIKTVADAHRRELGFVRRPALLEAIKHEEVFVAQQGRQVVGFVYYHHRRDGQTTLYDVAILPACRSVGIGRALIDAVVAETGALGKEALVLRCPVDLPANGFYARLGFERWKEEPGKRRGLVVWRLLIPPHR